MRPSLLCSVVLALLCCSCTLAMKYNQCDSPNDCPGADGGTQYCTDDHICTANTPEAKLCTETIPKEGIADAVHIGALLDLRMVNGVQVEQILSDALTLGVQQINSAVQFDGVKPIVIDVCNVGVSDVDADNATRILIEDRKVVAIIGPNSPAATGLMLGRIKAAGVPAISPAIIDSATANMANQGLFFRMAPLEIEQGLQLVSQLSTLSGGTSTSQLGLLSVASKYGSTIRAKFTAEWQRKDSNNLTQQFYEYNDSLSLRINTGSLVAAKPSFVVLIPGSDSLQAIQSLAELPLDPNAINSYVSTTQLLVTSSGRTPELLEAARTGSPGLKNHLARITGVAPLSIVKAEEGNDFKTSFAKVYPNESIEQDLMVGYTYDALYVIGAASAVQKGAQNSTQILNLLRRLTGSTTSLSLRLSAFKQTVQTLTQTATTGDPYTLLGVTGPIRFLANGGRDPVLLESWTIDTAKGHYINTPYSM